MRAIEVARAKLAKIMTEKQKLEDFLAMAEALEQEAVGVPEASLVETFAPPPPQTDLRLHGARPQSIRQRVEECVMAELTKYGARSTRELFMVLTDKGIDPAPSANDFDAKRNMLSTMLSKAKHLFTNDRSARVWRMIQPEPDSNKEETPSTPDAESQGGEPP